MAGTWRWPAHGPKTVERPHLVLARSLGGVEGIDASLGHVARPARAETQGLRIGVPCSREAG